MQFDNDSDNDVVLPEQSNVKDTTFVRKEKEVPQLTYNPFQNLSIQKNKSSKKK